MLLQRPVTKKDVGTSGEAAYNDERVATTNSGEVEDNERVAPRQEPKARWVSEISPNVNDFPVLPRSFVTAKWRTGEKDSDQAKSACLRCIAGVYIRTGESQSVQVHGLTVGHTGKVV